MKANSTYVQLMVMKMNYVNQVLKAGDDNKNIDSYCQKEKIHFLRYI